MKPKCKECQFCKPQIKNIQNTRYEFFCRHPNQNYIEEYCKRNKIRKMPGFIAFSFPHESLPAIQTSPKWCPMKK